MKRTKGCIGTAVVLIGCVQSPITLQSVITKSSASTTKRN
jgi:hypothetical protein